MLTEEAKQKRLERDIKILIDGILSILPNNPIAILLYGGYGRGEGSWYEDDEGNATPYNDYDVDIVTYDKVESCTIQTLRKKLALEIGIRWVDIGLLTPDIIMSFKPSIQNIDLKEASTLIYGDNEVYNLFPVMEKEKIGQMDVMKLYQTRIWTFLGSWEGEFHDMDVEESRFFNNQMAKAILAACDLLLISKKQYTTSYVRKANLAPTLYNITKLKEYSEWALTEKLNPSSVQITKEQMMKRYAEVKKIFIVSMEIALKEEWRYLMNPDMTFSHCYYNLSTLLRSIYYTIRRRENIARKKIDIFCAQNYVFHAWQENCINFIYLKKASDILLKWKYINAQVLDWNELRLLTSCARNNM